MPTRNLANSRSTFWGPAPLQSKMPRTVSHPSGKFWIADSIKYAQSVRLASGSPLPSVSSRTHHSSNFDGWLLFKSDLSWSTHSMGRAVTRSRLSLSDYSLVIADIRVACIMPFSYEASWYMVRRSLYSAEGFESCKSGPCIWDRNHSRLDRTTHKPFLTWAAKGGSCSTVCQLGIVTTCKMFRYSHNQHRPSKHIWASMYVSLASGYLMEDIILAECIRPRLLPPQQGFPQFLHCLFHIQAAIPQKPF